MLVWVKRLLLGLNVLNWVVGGLLLLLLAGTFIFEGPLTIALIRRLHRANIAEILADYRIVLALTAPMIAAAHIIFTRLIAIVDSVAAGDSFAAANATRLRQMAWALLASQIIDLSLAYFGPRLTAETGQYLGWSFGLTGWLAVLLLFVLARVFGDGTAMRDELAQVV